MKRQKLSGLFVFVVAFLVTRANDTVLAQSGVLNEYKVTDLGANITPYDINDVGQIVGYNESQAFPVSVGHAFRWTAGIMNDLGTLGGTSSTAWGINNSGQVVGVASTVDGSSHAFFFNGSMFDLGTLGGYNSSAFKINNHGIAVGVSLVPPDTIPISEAFIWNGTMAALGTFGPGSSALAINEANAVAGVYSPHGFDHHAFLWDGGPIDLLTLGGPGSGAYGMNNKGEVVGYADVDLSHTDAFLWNGAMLDLGTNGSVAYGINDSDEVVGDVMYGSPSGYAFLYKDGVMTNLNSLIPLDTGWVLSRAFHINNMGQIVGTGLKSGVSHGFLLNPSIFAPKEALIDSFQTRGIYTYEESGALAYEVATKLKWKNGVSTNADLESISRLTLSESAAWNGLKDADTLSVIATRGLTGSIDILAVLVSKMGGMINLVDKVPWFGKSLANLFRLGQLKLASLLQHCSDIFVSTIPAIAPQSYTWGWNFRRLTVPVALRPLVVEAVNEIVSQVGTKFTTIEEMNNWTKEAVFIDLLYQNSSRESLSRGLGYATARPTVFSVGQLHTAQMATSDRVQQMKSSDGNAKYWGETVLSAQDERVNVAKYQSAIGVLAVLSGALISGVGTPAAVLASIGLIGSYVEYVTVGAGLTKLLTSAGLIGYSNVFIPGYVSDATSISFDQPVNSNVSPLGLNANAHKLMNRKSLSVNSMQVRPISTSSSVAMQTSADGLKSTLLRMKQLIMNGNFQEVGIFLDTLNVAENAYTDSSSFASVPILAAYPAADTLISNYDSLYFQKFSSKILYYDERSSLMFYTLALLGLDTKNKRSVALALAELDTLSNAIDAMTKEIEVSTNALAAANIQVPPVVCPIRVDYPAVVQSNQQYTVVAHIRNVGGVPVSNVNVSYTPQDSADAYLNSRVASVGSLPPNGVAVVTWQLTAPGKDSGMVASIAALPDTIGHSYAAQSPVRILIYVNQSATGIKGDRGPPIPEKYEISQNYPNPFNPTTTIRFGLPHQSVVTLTVYNTLGQKVAQIVKGEMEAGYHDVKFDGTNVASGVYFYRIQAGIFVQTKELLLLK